MLDNISVIIPAYNAEGKICRTLKSIENQSKLEKIKEVIVVDDGSTDQTSRKIEEFKKESKLNIVLLSKENGGVSSARNYGLKYATGKWVAFCDADDEWVRDKIEHQSNIIDNSIFNIDLLGGNWRDSDVRIFLRKIKKLYSPSIEELCIKTFPQMSTIVVKTNVCKDIGGFDESLRCGEDGRFLFSIKSKYDYYYDPNKVVIFDNGKRGFGVSGLSSQLKTMHDGTVNNFKLLRKNKSISLPFYWFIRIYEQIKYFRRLALSR